MSNQLLQWRKSSTSDEWKELAFKSGTTPGYLNLVAYGYRNASPRLAQSIELASKCFPASRLFLKSLSFLRSIQVRILQQRCDMVRQSTAMPDPRYFLKLLPRSIRYDPINGIFTSLRSGQSKQCNRISSGLKCQRFTARRMLSGYRSSC